MGKTKQTARMSTATQLYMDYHGSVRIRVRFKGAMQGSVENLKRLRNMEASILAARAEELARVQRQYEDKIAEVSRQISKEQQNAATWDRRLFDSDHCFAERNRKARQTGKPCFDDVRIVNRPELESGVETDNYYVLKMDTVLYDEESE